MSVNLQKHAFTFAVLFAVLGALASQVQVSKLWGAPGQYFTLFDLFSALPAAFLGPLMGVAAVVIAKLAGALASNSPLDPVSLLRAFLPVSAGALFFWAYKNKQTPALNWLAVQILIPALCIALFVFHPAIFGTAAMAFAGFWLVPILASALLPDHLYLRSLGATLSQHAVGGVLWLYFVPAAANPAFWLALVPVAAVERLVFAGGISLSCLALNAALSRVEWVAKSGQVRLAPSPSGPEKKFRKR